MYKSFLNIIISNNLSDQWEEKLFNKTLMKMWYLTKWWSVPLTDHRVMLSLLLSLLQIQDFIVLSGVFFNFLQNKVITMTMYFSFEDVVLYRSQLQYYFCHIIFKKFLLCVDEWERKILWEWKIFNIHEGTGFD